MQYYIKFFNIDNGNFVGYYKEIGKSCITYLPKGTKYFNTFEEALITLRMYDEGFLRDKDKHYYKAKCVIYCDSHREPREVTYKRIEKIEEEREHAINSIVREIGGTHYR